MGAVPSLPTREEVELLLGEGRYRMNQGRGVIGLVVSKQWQTTFGTATMAPWRGIDVC